MSHLLFSEADIGQIESECLTVEKLLMQINLFESGVFPVNMNRSCTVNDGIVVIAEEDQPEIITLCNENILKGRMLKFVPASGAASRMFRDWYRYLEKDGLESRDAENSFNEDLKKYAFFRDLNLVIERNGESLARLLMKGNITMS